MTGTPRKPRALRNGARVALLAPAGPVTQERLQLSVERCHALGLSPVVYPSAHLQERYLAGPDAQRLADLQSAFDDVTIDGVWALRGGFGTTRILKQLDLTGMRARTKPFIGFSDNTAVHLLLARHGLVTFHGPHAGADFPPETEAAFNAVLFCAEPAGALPVRATDPQPRVLVPGVVEAPLRGGNLALLAALCGTEASLPARGHILFLEDVGEPAYRVDRLLVQLRDSGMFDGVVGLALGRFTETPAEADSDIETLLLEFARQMNVPALIDLPIGHVPHNWTLPLGVQSRLDAETGALHLLESAVTE